MPATRIALLPSLLLAVSLHPPVAEASNRWNLLNWCTQGRAEDLARCDGVLLAAIDLRTSNDFAGPRSCFQPRTRLPQVREAVVAWLKENRVGPEQSGLGLTARAIEESFPCATPGRKGRSSPE